MLFFGRGFIAFCRLQRKLFIELQTIHANIELFHIMYIRKTVLVTGRDKH
ncbi:hypothetical protein [Methanosalsum zhilinae]|nr:hypothetical protein [Methanosalsum zhilinae]